MKYLKYTASGLVMLLGCMILISFIIVILTFPVTLSEIYKNENFLLLYIIHLLPIACLVGWSVEERA